MEMDRQTYKATVYYYKYIIMHQNSDKTQFLLPVSPIPN